MMRFSSRLALSITAAWVASTWILAVPDPVGAAAPVAKPAAAQKTSGRFEMQSRTGTLRTYRAGKSVVIAGPDGRLKSLPIDPDARVDRGLVRGQQVNVISMTDETGRERVSSISRGARPATGNASESPSIERH